MPERRAKLASATLIAIACSFASHAHALRTDGKARAAAGMCAATASQPSAPAPAPASPAPSPSRSAEVPPASDDDVPWCVGANDPRCAPLHHDSGVPKMTARTMIPACVSALPRIPTPIAQPITAAHEGLGACAGVHSRVERPPRADRGRSQL